MTPINPYIAGNPVGGGDAFIGRADVLREVVRVLRSPGENALVLYGQRRIGKTSVLQELIARLPTEGPYRPVFFDLQDKAALPLGRVLQELAARITDNLELPPPSTWTDDAPRAFRADFIPQVLAHLPADTSLVLLFDEFDVLDNPGEAQAGAAFFPYLRDLLSLDPRLQFLFVIGRRPEDLSSLTLSVFKGIKSRYVSLMSPEETSHLVRLAERNDTLHWSDEAVAQVYALTGGHPFLTQQLCREVWDWTYQDEPEELPTISSSDVETAAPLALSSAKNALEWLWDGLKPAQRIVASALAETGPEALSQDELNQRLLDSGVRILIGELQDAPRMLQEWDLIEPVKDGYRFQVELLRRWIAERKPLARAQEEIDRIQPVADNLFQAAYNLYQGGQLEQAIPLLRQAIGFNPNHLRANQLLAEILLAQGELTEARQLLESLYQYQPAAARPRLVQVVLRQSQDAKNDEERLALFERILQLDPHQPEALSNKRHIWEKRGDTARDVGNLSDALDAYSRADLQEKKRKIEGFIETDLDGLYVRALIALQEGNIEVAQRLLARVVRNEPRYREATRYLHLAATGVDVAEVQAKLKNETKTRQDSEAELRQEIDEHDECLKKTANLLSKLKDQEELLKKAEKEVERIRSAFNLSIYRLPDYGRLLWWLFITPQRVSAYKNIFGSESLLNISKWLVSTLVWSPLAVPIFGLGMGTLPWEESAWPPIACFLWLSGGVTLAWLLTGWLGNRLDENYFIVGLVIFGMMVTTAGGFVGGMTGGVAVGVASAVAIGVGLSIGYVLGLEFCQLEGGCMVKVGIFIWYFMIVGMVLTVGGGSVVGVLMGFVLGFVAGVVVLVVSAGVAKHIKTSVNEGRPSWIVRGAFVALLLTHAFIVWFSFFGGWQVFV